MKLVVDDLDTLLDAVHDDVMSLEGDVDRDGENVSTVADTSSDIEYDSEGVGRDRLDDLVEFIDTDDDADVENDFLDSESSSVSDCE